jgi:hypothetical protein
MMLRTARVYSKLLFFKRLPRTGPWGPLGTLAMANNASMRGVGTKMGTVISCKRNAHIHLRILGSPPKVPPTDLQNPRVGCVGLDTEVVASGTTPVDGHASRQVRPCYARRYPRRPTWPPVSTSPPKGQTPAMERTRGARRLSASGGRE